MFGLSSWSTFNMKSWAQSFSQASFDHTCLADHGRHFTRTWCLNVFDDFGFPFSLSQQTETGGGQDLPFSKNKPVRHLLQVCGLLQGSCLAPKEAAFGETSPTTVVVEILHVIYMAGPLQEKLLVFGKTQLTWPTPKRCRSTEPPKCNKAEEHRNSTITGNILTNYAYEIT